MIKHFATILVCCILLNCNTQPKPNELTGIYKAKTPNLLVQAYNNYKKAAYVVGSEITLKTDSTFIYTTCGNIITGNWFVIKDSIYLKVNTNYYKNDSLNQIRKPKIGKKPIALKIFKNTLYEEDSSFFYRNNNKILFLSKTLFFKE
jgi:hypothetical protein